MKDELKSKKNKPPHLTGHHEALGCMKLTTSLCLWNQVPTCVCLSFAKCAKPRPSGNQPDAKENQLVGLRDIYLALWSQVLRMALQTVLGHRGRALFLDLGDAAGSANSRAAGGLEEARAVPSEWGAWMCLRSPEGGHGGVSGGSSGAPERADTSPWSRVPAVAPWCARITPTTTTQPLTEGLPHPRTVPRTCPPAACHPPPRGLPL